MPDIIHTETEANRVSEAMARMRRLVLARAPGLMRTGQYTAGVSSEHLSPARRAALVAKLRALRAYTYDAAAEEFGVDRRTVFSIARAAGIRRHRRLSPRLKAKGLRRIHRGESCYAVARQLGVSATVFKRLLKK